MPIRTNKYFDRGEWLSAFLCKDSCPKGEHRDRPINRETKRDQRCWVARFPSSVAVFLGTFIWGSTVMTVVALVPPLVVAFLLTRLERFSVWQPRRHHVVTTTRLPSIPRNWGKPIFWPPRNVIPTWFANSTRRRRRRRHTLNLYAWRKPKASGSANVLHYHDYDNETDDRQAAFRAACQAQLGLPAEIVEECKQNPVFRVWLHGNNSHWAQMWRTFLAGHGGWAPQLVANAAVLEAGNNGGPQRRRRRRQRHKWWNV